MDIHGHLVASSRRGFVQSLQRMAATNGFDMQNASTLADTDRLCAQRSPILIITDCHLSDVWFDTAFTWFDEAARHRDLVMIFDTVATTRKYRSKARSARDMFPVTALTDQRFPSIFALAALRSELFVGDDVPA